MRRGRLPTLPSVPRDSRRRARRVAALRPPYPTASPGAGIVFPRPHEIRPPGLDELACQLRPLLGIQGRPGGLEPRLQGAEAGGQANEHRGEGVPIQRGLLGGGLQFGPRLPQGRRCVGQLRVSAIAVESACDGLAAHGNHERISARASSMLASHLRPRLRLSGPSGPTGRPSGSWPSRALERIVSGRTKNHQLHELLPWEWKTTRTAQDVKAAA